MVRHHGPVPALLEPDALVLGEEDEVDAVVVPAVAGALHIRRGRPRQVGVGGLGVHVAADEHRAVRGERVAQLQQDVHPGAVLLGAGQRRVAVLLWPAVRVGHVVGGDHRHHGAVGALENHPGREPVPGDRPTVVEGLVVVHELDATAVGLGPGRPLPEHDVAHGLLGTGTGLRRCRFSEGVVARGRGLDLGEAPAAGLVQGDEVGVLGQHLGHRGPEPVEAGAARDVGLGHGDLALDRASHGAVDGTEVAELGGC